MTTKDKNNVYNFHTIYAISYIFNKVGKMNSWFLVCQLWGSRIWWDPFVNPI